MSEVSEAVIPSEQPKVNSTITEKRKVLLEKEGNPQPKSVDLLIVLGQGPVKPLLLSSELDPERKNQWEEFKKDPLHSKEPDFRVLEGEAAKKLEGLDEAQVQAQLAELQQLGRFGLNRWGRENALAAGFALFSGYTDRLLLSGGKTMPGWAKEKLPPQRIESWPSEAQLMADIIRRRFGALYQEKYGKPIDGVIILEDKSTNTLENFANSINSGQGQDILNAMVKTGVLAANFHVPRGEDIAYLFAPTADLKGGSSAQRVLEATVAGLKNHDTYEEILKWMSDPNNEDLRGRAAMEDVWSGALKNPELLTYWLGYIGIVEDPRVLQSTVQRLNLNPVLQTKAREVFNLVGLDFDSIALTDLTKMDPAQFRQNADKLKILSTKEYRTMPKIPNNPGNK